MKKIIYTLVFVSFYSTYSQVGIGTTNPDPSAILHLKSTTQGVLPPCLTTSQINNIEAPAKGLIFYNKDLNSVVYNSGTTTTVGWNTITSSSSGGTATGNNNSVKYTNTNTSTNINQTNPTPLPIFGTLKWNDNNALFHSVTSNSITISETGRYRIVSNISIVGINSSGSTEHRTAVEAFVAVNGTQVGANSSTGYIRFASNHDSTSLHINETLNLNAGDIISIQSHKTANSGTVRFKNSGYSNILIEKI